MLLDYDIENAIEKEEYITVGEKTTLCVITLKNGFEVVGSSACVKKENYNFETGKVYARKKAIDTIWQLEGYREQCENA